MKTKQALSQTQWEKTDEYKIAVLLKVVRAMKAYGYSGWMSAELKKIGVSL